MPEMVSDQGGRWYQQGHGGYQQGSGTSQLMGSSLPLFGCEQPRDHGQSWVLICNHCVHKGIYSIGCRYFRMWSLILMMRNTPHMEGLPRAKPTRSKLGTPAEHPQFGHMPHMFVF